MADLFAGLPAPGTGPEVASGFTRNPLLRQSEAQDQTAIATALEHPSARLLLFIGADLKLPQSPEKGATLSPYVPRQVAEAEGADLSRALLLGTHDGIPVLAAPLPRPTAPEPQNPATSHRAGAYGKASEVIDLRSLAMHGFVSPEDLGIIGHAGSLMNWHRGHGHCARCGAETAIEQGGYRRGCPACGRHHFPRTDPVVIMLAIHGDRAVLGRQPRFVEGMYSCLAGFVEPGETIEAATRRELAEESGLAIGRVRYFASQPWPFPHTLMIGCLAEALSEEITPDTDELEDCRWFSRDTARAMLARSHPEGLFTPPPMAIAHQIIRFWAESN
ncbi:MAG: NAD(+) diphosphatase [Pseudomonadota bacterium]